MAYTAFDPAKPDAATDNGTNFATNTRNNFKAVRDAVIMGGGFYGWNLNATGASGTASFSGTTMTVSAVSAGSFEIGQAITATSVTANTVITALGTGKGGTGTYTLNNSQSALSDRATTGTNTVGSPESLTYSKSTERVRAGLTWSAGKVTVSKYYYSADSGATYDLIGTNTITYDGSNYVTGTTWS